MLAAAVAYAEWGLHVFPCHTVSSSGLCTCGKKDCSSPAKHPLARRGFLDGTTDARIILNWDEIYGAGRWNLAVATGAVSGVIVLDIDGETGMQTYRLLSGTRSLPETWIVVTPRGWHVYFKHPGFPVQNSAAKLGAGLDIRGDGGYVIVPPSQGAGGKRYRWARGRAPGELEQ